jgi:SEC-C motif-containing protein
MRSRYAAYVVHDAAYLLRTWHPRTRPGELDFSHGPSWVGLTVVASADGLEGDTIGEVEFEASYDGGVLHERSRFTRRAGRWVYVDGDGTDA